MFLFVVAGLQNGLCGKIVWARCIYSYLLFKASSNISSYADIVVNIRNQRLFILYSYFNSCMGYAVAHLVEALLYKPKSWGFDSR
jgi:hypothetical protein